MTLLPIFSRIWWATSIANNPSTSDTGVLVLLTMDCKKANNNNGNGYAEVSEVCEELYLASAHCETNMETGTKEGMCTFRRSVTPLVADGRVDAAEANELLAQFEDDAATTSPIAGPAKPASE